MKNTSGAIKKLLNEARIKSHAAHLEELTVIEDYERRFIRSKTMKDVDENTRAELIKVSLHKKINIKKNCLFKAFQGYLKSIPQSKKNTGSESDYNIKDIVARSSPGIGSAGKISYSILLEGPTETLENDIIIYMKPAQKSAISYVISSPELEKYFQHDGLRTVLCSYAMQAATPKFLGYTTFNNIPMLVDEVPAHSCDLEWGDINEFSDVLEVVQYLGQATGLIK